MIISNFLSESKTFKLKQKFFYKINFNAKILIFKSIPKKNSTRNYL